MPERSRQTALRSLIPNAAADLSIAAQHQDPSSEDVNKRLDWQMKDQEMGLQYTPLRLESAKLFIFVDGSFVNNKKLNSQIGFIIVLANKNQSISQSLYIFLLPFSSDS